MFIKIIPGLPEYVVLKLDSGEDVFGKLVSSEDNTVVLSSPLVLVQAMHPETKQPVMTFAPYMELSDSDITFAEEKIVAHGEMSKQLQVDYKNAISPIITPGKAGLIV